MRLDTPALDYLKRCPSCGESKMVESGFGWRIWRDRRYAISLCRECKRQRRNPDGSWIRSTDPQPPSPQGHARCPDCGETKPVTEFGRHKATSTGRSVYCGECSRRQKRDHVAAMGSEQLADYRRRKALSCARNPQTRRRRHLRLNFNMSLERYEQMFVDQGGRCAICRNPETVVRNGMVLDLAVDHDHACCPEKGRSCGECVRGLLCSRCNHGLGYFADDPTRLSEAITYLAAHREARP